jgi:FtsH-binding integral membrane protein
MKKPVLFIACIVAVLIGIAVFNLIIGVAGLNWAILTMVGSIIFSIFTTFHTQPDKEDPHA